MKNISSLLKLLDAYYDYLKKQKFEFDDRGFPIFKNEMFLKEYPEMVVPYNQRNNCRVRNPKNTVICTFCKDYMIYSRLEKILEDIGEYKKFKGVIVSDLTVTKDMDLECQNLIMLLNQMYGAILATNNVPIIMNARNGNLETLINFDSIPNNVMYATSFLGCKNEKEYSVEFITKILKIRSSKLIIYGKEDKIANEKLDKFGIDYRYYSDFHSLCRKQKK